MVIYSGTEFVHGYGLTKKKKTFKGHLTPLSQAVEAPGAW